MKQKLSQPIGSYKIIRYLNPFEPFLAMKNLKSGKAADYEVVCRDGKFGVHLYCLINSDFLYKQYEARKNFEGEGKGSNKIMFTMLYCNFDMNMAICFCWTIKIKAFAV